ncbi:MAG TPA: hypothetical protein VNS58_21905 [Puia sp.]|nr:hypothetical protein [Puia sp.]
MKTYLSIKDETDYQKTVARYEKIRNATKDSHKQKERLSLALLINQYEERDWKMPFIDPVELNQIRSKEFGYPASH